MHFIKAKNILSSKFGMNIYRGCEHGCIYCDTRSKCYGFTHDFEDIEVKENALDLLEVALKRKKERCMIGLGSMSDPYMPLENKLHYTRGFLELINKYEYGATLITKSDNVLNDLDLIKEINNKTKCVIQMTLTTYDEKLCKLLEPGAPTTSKRFEALKILNDNGIPTVVWLCPILPFINDDLENLKGLLDYCLKAKVKGILNFGFGVTLREGDREYFYDKLDLYFPGLKDKYIKTYGDAYGINSPNNNLLMKYFYKFCKDNHIMCNNDEIFKYLNTFETKYHDDQLSLF